METLSSSASVPVAEKKQNNITSTEMFKKTAQKCTKELHDYNLNEFNIVCKLMVSYYVLLCLCNVKVSGTSVMTITIF